MGTEMLAITNLVVILQVVSTVLSAYPDGSQIVDPDYNRQGADHTKNYFIQEKKPVPDGITISPNFAKLDDINEMQIPPPPTQKDTLPETNFEANNADDVAQGTSKYYTSTDINIYSGAGHIDTNEIVKNPKTLPQMGSLSNSNDNKYNNKYDASKQQEPAAFNNYPKLDKAVENAVNNLPSADQSPLVPLIKVMSRRLNDKSGNTNISPEELERRRFLQKQIILKLSRAAQRQKEEHDTQVRSQEPEVQERQETVIGSQIGNNSEINDDSQPCDCEGGCNEEPPQVQTMAENPGCDEETAQVHIESEKTMFDQRTTHDQTKLDKDGFGRTMLKDQNILENTHECGEDEDHYQTETENTPVQVGQSEDYDNQINKHPKLLAHIVVMLRKTKKEETNSLQTPPLTPLSTPGNVQLIRPPEISPLADILLRVITKSTSMNIIPTPSVEQDYERPREELISGTITGGCGDDDNGDESEREQDRSFFPRVATYGNNDEFSEYRKQSPVNVFLPDNQDPSIQSVKRLQNSQTAPKEFILLKAMINAMRQKAAVNALKERQMKGLFPMPPFEELSSSPSPPISRLVIIRPGNELPSTQLPPLNFPDETSGFKIVRNPDNSENEIEPLIRVKTLHSAGGDDGDVLAQRNSAPEIPWFIKNIIANVSRQTGQGGLQPITSPLISPNGPAEEIHPILF